MNMNEYDEFCCGSHFDLWDLMAIEWDFNGISMGTGMKN